METIPLPRLGFLRGVFLANHLASTDNLTSNNKETEHIQTQTNVNTKIVLHKQKYTHKDPVILPHIHTAQSDVALVTLSALYLRWLFQTSVGPCDLALKQ